MNGADAGAPQERAETKGRIKQALAAIRELAWQMGGNPLGENHPHVGAIHAWCSKIEAEVAAPAAHQERTEPPLTVTVEREDDGRYFASFEFPEQNLNGTTRYGPSALDALRNAVTDISCATEGAPARAAEWQPISTAPKDGTNVLLGWPTMAMGGYWADWHGRKAWVTARGEYQGENAPTAWQPLPWPPGALAGDSKSKT